MNKKRLIIISLIVFSFIIGLVILSKVLGYHTVSFTNPYKVSVQLYNSSDSKTILAHVNTNETMSLQNGTYCTTADGAQYDHTPTCFTITGKSVAVALNPNYSTDYLAQLLPPEQTAINTVINQKYSAIIDQYTLISGKLYGRGEWYGTTLTEKLGPSDRGDVYRILLKKVNDTWNVIAYPQITLSKYDYPQVPFAILSDLNKQLGVY